MHNVKTGLVLEGGAMRGLFTAGVIDVLMEHGVAFDGMIGVSAGAAFGCNYKSNQPGRVVRYLTKYVSDPRYGGLRCWLRTGDLFNAQFCYHEIPDKLDPFDAETFRKSPMAFYLVCTDVRTGRPVYKKCDVMDETGVEWVRASASMPLAARVVEVEGYKLLDGGLADSIPLRYLENQGYGRNVVILTQPEGFVKKKNRMLPAVRAALRQYPKVADTLARRHTVYNETRAYVAMRQREGAVYAIYPDTPLEIGHYERDPERLRAVYQRGRAAGAQHLEAICAFLERPAAERI